MIRIDRRQILAALLVIGAAGAAGAEPKLEPLTLVTSGGRHAFEMEIAADSESISQGLMFRTSLAPDRGMLFDFRRQEQVSFWMKNTYVSLDMIFARADGTIVNIAHATQPLSERPIPSEYPVRFVVEVVAGTAKRIGLKPGDRIEHRLVSPAG